MITHEQIAKRAYEIHLARGAQPGHEVEDWLQEEAELKKQLEKSAPIAVATLPPARSVSAATMSSLSRMVSAPGLLPKQRGGRNKRLKVN